jgi:hypothetical protein
MLVHYFLLRPRLALPAAIAALLSSMGFNAR